MTFNSFLPHNDFLRRFVAYYYADGSADRLYRNSYLFYPHINTTVSFYKNAVCRLDETGAVISYDADTRYLKLVTQQSLPRRTLQIGRTNKIAIVFKPLGLNRFINEKYSDLVSNEVQIFSPRDDAEWNKMLDELFNQVETFEKTKILDGFLLGVYNGFANEVLEKATAMLSDVENNAGIAEIADALGISRKTLLRHFKAELRITPELFRMISRFRFALNEKMLNDSPDTLTRIACQANFFDQPHFIKRFKLLTGVTPTQFFKESTRIGQQDTFWTFASQIS